eukprot:9417822-Pyramimonas_sp.AAC.1
MGGEAEKETHLGANRPRSEATVMQPGSIDVGSAMVHARGVSWPLLRNVRDRETNGHHRRRSKVATKAG